MQLFYVPAHVSGNERERFVCIVPQFDGTSRSTNMPRANRRQQTEMERWRVMYSGPQTAQTHCDTAQNCAKVHCSLCCHCGTNSVHHCQPQKSVSQAKSGSERASPALSLWSSCLVLFVLCVLATAETHSTFGKHCCPPWFATYCMLRLCGSCGLDPSLLAKFHLNTANVIELPRHLLLAMILLLQSPFASQSVWLCGCWVAVAKKLSLAAPPPFLCWLATICLLLLLLLPACLASLCVYNYLHKLQ